MSEFRVDKPGRYRLRDGDVARVLKHEKRTSDPYLEWEGQIKSGEDWLYYAWAVDGRAYPNRQDWPNDLIAYLGPLEDEKRDTLCWKCSKAYPMYDPRCQFCQATNANVDHAKAQAEATTVKNDKPAEPTISDAAWSLIANHTIWSRKEYVDLTVRELPLVLRTREEWEERGYRPFSYLHFEQKCDELQRELTAAREEIDKLRQELARKNAEIPCDHVVGNLKATLTSSPRIPLTTPQIERYTTPMLGTQR